MNNLIFRNYFRIGATKNKRATKANTSSSSASLGVSRITPFLVGTVFGILITSIFFIKFSTTDINIKIPKSSKDAKLQSNIKNKQKVTRNTSTGSKNSKYPEPKFEFYNELTNNSYDVNASTTAEKNINLKSLKSSPYVYSVQAGSFVKRSDAEVLKANLTLNGFRAKTEGTKLDDGQLWYRVMIGPFDSQDDAIEQQIRLKSIDVNNTLVLRQVK